MRNILLVIAILAMSFLSFSQPNSKTINVKSYSELIVELDKYKMDLPTVRETKKMPNIRILNINRSIKELTVHDKKRAFISSILLATVSVNNEICENRKKLKLILKKDKSSRTSADNTLLNHILKETRLNAEQEDKVLQHYDLLPVSLVISQAILESAWGTSHFAVEGNSLFGEHISHSSKGKYIQSTGSDVRLRAFTSIEEAVKGYIHNLNRNNAYRGLRIAREGMRKKDKHLDGIALANTEDHYSEIGHDYTKRIILVINQNKLQEYDNCNFENTTTLTSFRVN